MAILEFASLVYRNVNKKYCMFMAYLNLSQQHKKFLIKHRAAAIEGKNIAYTLHNINLMSSQNEIFSMSRAHSHSLVIIISP